MVPDVLSTNHQKKKIPSRPANKVRQKHPAKQSDTPKKIRCTRKHGSKTPKAAKSAMRAGEEQNGKRRERQALASAPWAERKPFAWRGKQQARMRSAEHEEKRFAQVKRKRKSSQTRWIQARTKRLRLKKYKNGHSNLPPAEGPNTGKNTCGNEVHTKLRRARNHTVILKEKTVQWKKTMDTQTSAYRSVDSRKQASATTDNNVNRLTHSTCSATSANHSLLQSAQKQQ